MYIYTMMIEKGEIYYLLNANLNFLHIKIIKNQPILMIF